MHRYEYQIEVSRVPLDRDVPRPCAHVRALGSLHIMEMDADMNADVDDDIDIDIDTDKYRYRYRQI